MNPVQPLDTLPADVRRYLEDLPDDRKGMVLDLHALVISLYPEARVDLSYRMPTYRNGAGWVALANQRRYVSLYTCGAHHLHGFRQRHPDIRTGKGCINFSPARPLPMNDIAGVIRHAMDDVGD